MKVVLTRRLPGGYEERLGRTFDEVRIVEKGRPLTSEELRDAASDCDVAIVTVCDRVDESFLDACPKLRAVMTFSVGIDHLDVAALKSRGISACNTPAVLTDATADLAWALILACARRVKPAIKLMEAGHFQGFEPMLLLGKELSGLTLGIVGLGKIGQAVALRGEAFGMEVISIRRYRSELTLDELLRRADVVSLHCPLTPETRGMIGHRELALMKTDAILVNTARGPLVDETALVRHLRSHPEFQAGLDVFEEEPRLAAGLLECPNALALPHIGSATGRARGKMAEVAVDEAIRFAKGERLQYQI